MLNLVVLNRVSVDPPAKIKLEDAVQSIPFGFLGLEDERRVCLSIVRAHHHLAWFTADVVRDYVHDSQVWPTWRRQIGRESKPVGDGISIHFSKNILELILAWTQVNAIFASACLGDVHY